MQVERKLLEHQAKSVGSGPGSLIGMTDVQAEIIQGATVAEGLSTGGAQISGNGRVGEASKSEDLKGRDDGGDEGKDKHDKKLPGHDDDGESCSWDGGGGSEQCGWEASTRDEVEVNHEQRGRQEHGKTSHADAASHSEL